MLSSADRSMLTAMAAMAGQLQDARTRNAIAAVLNGSEPNKQDVIRQRVVSGKEAARILNLTKRSVQLLARAGTIKRAVLPGRSRGFGYLRDSVEELATGVGGRNEVRPNTRGEQ